MSDDSNAVVPTNEQYLGRGVNFFGIGSEKPDNVIDTTRAVLKSEYLTAGLNVNDDLYYVLNHNRDVFSGVLTDAVIKEMLRDPEVFKCFNVIRQGVLGDGVSFRPAIPEPTTISKPLEGEVESEERRKERIARDQQIERFILAKQYSDFTTRAFDNLATPIVSTLQDLMFALPYGNRVAEKVYVLVKDKDFGEGKLYLDKLNVKPRENTTFVVDKYNNLIGLKAYVKKKDKDGKEVVEPKIVRKEKFAILTFGSRNGDPRGTSFLESAYTAYQLKMLLWPEYLRWLIYSAVPPIVGYTSNETDSRKVLRDANGDIVTDKDGNTVFESDVGALLQALKNVRNASAIALPYGAQVDTLNSGVSGDPFKGFRDVLNAEMEMGLIHQTLATSDSRHNTRAASQTHISILDDLIWSIKGTVRDMITGMVKHLMEVNFPNFDKSLTPIVNMGDTNRREFQGDVGAISQLSISEFLGESQKKGIDDLLGLPPRDVYSDREFERNKKLEEIRMQAELARLTAPPPTTPTDSTKTKTPTKSGNGDN